MTLSPDAHHALDRALADEPEVFAYGSIDQVGRKFAVSPATILRFAQALGYSGYGALQAAVRKACVAEGSRTAVGAETVERLDHAWSCHRDDVDRLHRAVQLSELHRAARLVFRARRRLVAGDGPTEDLAPLFASQLRHIQLPAYVLRASASGGPVVPGDVGPGDVVVAVGVRAEAAVVARMLAGCGARGGSTIAIADAASGPVPGAAALTLVAPATAIGRMHSVVATAAMIELLMAEIVRHQEDWLAASRRRADTAALRGSAARPRWAQRPAEVAG